MRGFWIVHSGLDREGPGLPEDIAWAAAAAGVPSDGRICDVGCGPGGDLAALAAAVPQGRVLGLEKHLGFVVEGALRHAEDPRVTVRRGLLLHDGDLPSPATTGPHDLIWCAGAIYFCGVEAALRAWTPALTATGAIAFSAPIVNAADDAEAAAFWGGDGFDTEATLDAAIGAAGCEVLARDQVADAGWEAYYAALEARCTALDVVDDPEIVQAVAETRAEAADWSAMRSRVGYALRVVRPV